MKLKALIIESTSYYQSLLQKILSDIGVECVCFRSGKEALDASHEEEYAFIIVSRYIDEINGEMFLHNFREKFPIGDALTIMLTSDEVSKVILGANQAGFKLVFNHSGAWRNIYLL